MNCPKCQSLIQPNTRFCGTCGQAIEAASPGVAASATAAPAAAAAAATAGEKSGAAAAASSAASAAMPGLLQRIKNIVLTPNKQGTEVQLVYNLGGYVLNGYQALPISADGVLGLQLFRLKQLLETGSANTPRPPEKKP